MASSTNSEIQPDHIIIWCDRNMGQRNTNEDAKAVLEEHANVVRLPSGEPAPDIDQFICHMNPYLNQSRFDNLIKSPLRMFTNENECLKCIQDSIQAKKRVFLITSGQTGAIIIPQIHQILSGYIYVFCAQISLHEEWSGPYEKDIIFYDDDKGVFARVLADIGAYYLSKAGDIEDSVPATAAQYYYWARRLIMSASRVDQHNRKDHLNYIEGALASIHAAPTDGNDTDGQVGEAPS